MFGSSLAGWGKPLYFYVRKLTWRRIKSFAWCKTLSAMMSVCMPKRERDPWSPNYHSRLYQTDQSNMVAFTTWMFSVSMGMCSFGTWVFCDQPCHITNKNDQARKLAACSRFASWVLHIIQHHPTSSDIIQYHPNITHIIFLLWSSCNWMAWMSDIFASERLCIWILQMLYTSPRLPGLASRIAYWYARQVHLQEVPYRCCRVNSW